MVSGFRKDGVDYITYPHFQELEKEIQSLKSQLEKKVMTIEELYKRMKQSESQNEKLQKVIDKINIKLEKNNTYRFSDMRGDRMMIGMNYEELKSILSEAEK